MVSLCHWQTGAQQERDYSEPKTEVGAKDSRDSENRWGEMTGLGAQFTARVPVKLAERLFIYFNELWIRPLTSEEL